jgi:hypothetical protein
MRIFPQDCFVLSLARPPAHGVAVREGAERHFITALRTLPARNSA